MNSNDKMKTTKTNITKSYILYKEIWGMMKNVAKPRLNPSLTIILIIINIRMTKRILAVSKNHIETKKTFWSVFCCDRLSLSELRKAHLG